jgi:hypothetical protein
MKQRKHILKRIKQLRNYNAPKWLIKNEQVDLALIRAFRFRRFPVGHTMAHDYWQQLLDKHVRPLMDGVGYINLPDDQS